MESLPKDSFPASFTTSTVIDSVEHVLLRMPSVKKFPDSIDWGVKPGPGLYMFQVVNDMLEIMWGETKIEDPAVVAKRAKIEADRISRGLGSRHTA